MKKPLILLFIFSIFYINQANTQILKKLSKKISEGVSDAFEYTKVSVSDAIEIGKIKGILKAVKENEFEKANEKIIEFREKYPRNQMYYYLNYLIHESENSTYKNYDIAFKSLEKIQENGFGFINYMDDKEKEKLWKDYNFCKDSLISNYSNIQLKLLISLNSNENSISSFILMYPKSEYLDSAIRIRHNIRYENAKKINTISGYFDFIQNNQDARQLKEARYNLSILMYKKALQENTLQALEDYLSLFAGQLFLDERIKLQIKYLKLQDINSDYKNIISKYGTFIFNFSLDKYADESSIGIDFSNTVSRYNNSSEYYYDKDKITYSIINDGKIRYNSKELFDPLLMKINDFEKKYPESIELSSIQNIKIEVNELKAKIDFYIISRYWTSIDAYEKYINTYPGTSYAIILKNKKELLEKIKKREDDIAKANEEAARAKAEDLARVEREKAEQASIAQSNAIAEEKKKKEQESNIMYQIAKRLGPADNKMLLDILENKIDSDPQSRVGDRCGTGYSSCKWCGRSVSYEKTLKSRVQLIRMFQLGSPLLGVLMPIANIFGQLGGALTGAKPKNLNYEKMMNELTIEMRGYLQNIRKGNYYYCDGGGGDLFCSLKCQNDYKYRR